ncbi:MAG: arsenosugar biosynthesis radical SAM protein ArsS [Cyanobacteria bacterium SID2]|nr:arsenosugar biosynthesis radical SAM protein ArsS [Cyanobacteria bacterium SID2]MBP0004323.1 arsenosugar biosynthesis radical SAM protein ArsS [Cyanobacteria bacterium SBC]
MIQAPPFQSISITPFSQKLQKPLTKKKITVLQINLGKKCNLACTHCHVEASPKRTEELSPEICDRLIEVILGFPQIKTVDLTGGAPEMNFGFKPLVEAASQAGKEIIVRSNLTIFFVPGYEDLPEYFTKHRVRVIASLPCYLADNVDKMRGNGVFDRSIRALQQLNEWGYGRDPNLQLDLVYNPPIPTSEEKFSLPPAQMGLERAYKQHLSQHFGIAFNQLLTITNLPIGRTKQFLQRQHLDRSYTQFLENNFNPSTVEGLMCRNQLSVDYLGNLYDCDFNQMEGVSAVDENGEPLTVEKLLDLGSLDVIETVQTESYCYGCTAGCGSSCGGALV